MRVGGYTCRSWRLKKKQDKQWNCFARMGIKAMLTALREMPPGTFEKACSCPDYDFRRLWRPRENTE